MKRENDFFKLLFETDAVACKGCKIKCEFAIPTCADCKHRNEVLTNPAHCPTCRGLGQGYKCNFEMKGD